MFHFVCERMFSNIRCSRSLGMWLLCMRIHRLAMARTVAWERDFEADAAAGQLDALAFRDPRDDRCAGPADAASNN